MLNKMREEKKVVDYKYGGSTIMAFRRAKTIFVKFSLLINMNI